MAEEQTEKTAAEAAAAKAAEEGKQETEDQRVPYERFQQANTKAKEAAEKATTLEKELKDLRAQLEERESAGLPELERERKAREKLERELADERKAREEGERKTTRMERKGWVTEAAGAAGFKYPNIAANLDEIDLDTIENADDAARAIKTAAKKYPDLLKGEDPPLPGRVLENGRKTAGKKDGGIDLDAEAQMVSDELKKFVANRRG